MNACRVTGGVAYQPFVWGVVMNDRVMIDRLREGPNIVCKTHVEVSTTAECWGARSVVRMACLAEIDRLSHTWTAHLYNV